MRPECNLNVPLGAFSLIVAAALTLATAAFAQFPGGPMPAGATVPSGATVLRNLPYVPNRGHDQQLDLYLPAGAGKHPVIVYIHGGAWLGGDKNNPLAPTRLLSKGFAVASLNYRLSSAAIFPAQIEDCKAAVRWLRAHAGQYHLDSNRFIAWGESAGGHLAALLGTAGQTKTFDVGDNLKYSSAVQGVVDYYGPTDFSQMEAHIVPGGMHHGGADTPEGMLVGGDISQHAALVQSANPIAYVSRKSPPFFIAHGENDHLVPFNQSQLLVAALQKAGVPVTFHPVPGADHVFMGATPAQMKDLDAATDAFLAGLVRPGH